MDLTPVTRPANAAPWKKTSTSTKMQLAAVILIPSTITFSTMVLGLDFSVALVLVLLPLQLIATAAYGYIKHGRKGIADAVMLVGAFFLSTVVLTLLLSVLWSVIVEGGKAISWSFLTQNNRYISATTDLDYGGVGHAIVGTLMVVGITTLVAVPLGLGIAVLLTETRSRYRGPIRVLIQAMSGLPSVVAGLFIYSAFIVSGVVGYSALAGALALIPLMLPTVARVAEEALRLVSKDLRNGALALGAPSYRAFFQVTLPAALSGVITALLLGIARVIGETAPMLLTVGGNNRTNFNPLEAVATLPTYMYTFLGLGKDFSIARAWGAALTILILVGIFFTAARVISRPKQAKRKVK